MRLVGFDCETYLIQPGLLAPPLVCVSFCDGAIPELLNAKDGVAKFREYLLDDDVRLVAHNAPFDLGVMCSYDLTLLPLVFRALDHNRITDTLLRQVLIDIATEGERRDAYTLADLLFRHFKIERFEEKKNPNAWRLRFNELDGVPVVEYPPAATKYACDDAVDARAVCLAQGDVVPTEFDQMRSAWGLHLMSVWGMRTDVVAVNELESSLIAARKAIFEGLIKSGLYKTKRAGPGETPDFYEPEYTKVLKSGKAKVVAARPMRFSKDTAAIKKRVELAYAEREVPLTDSGQTSTDRDCLERSGDADLRALAEMGAIDKLLTTYIPVLRQGVEFPINARYNTIVDSGRTSCSNPNLQNLPRGSKFGDVRAAFVPRPGYHLISVDYDTLELRALAQVLLELFGWSKMADALNAGRDLHLDFASQLLGISYEEAVTRYDAGDKEVKAARQWSKVANFGIPGGLGVDTLIEYARIQYGVVLTRTQARKLKADWLKAYPEMQLFFDYVAARVEDGRATFTDPRTGYVRGGCGYCDGCNTHFQGRAAFGAKAAVYEVARECYVDCGTALFGCRPVVFAHDEIIPEVPADPVKGDAAAKRLVEVMCSTMSRYIPDILITAKPARMARWLKSAEPVYGDDGLLRPWSSAV